MHTVSSNEFLTIMVGYMVADREVSTGPITKSIHVEATTLRKRKR